MVEVKEPKTHAMYQSIMSEFLQPLVKIFPELLSGIIILPRRTIAEQILILLRDKPIEEIARHLIVRGEIVRHSFPRKRIQDFLILHNRAVMLTVIVLCNQGVIVQPTSLVDGDRTADKIEPISLTLSDLQQILIGILIHRFRLPFS